VPASPGEWMAKEKRWGKPRRPQTTHLVWKPLRSKLFAKGKHQISQHLVTWAIPKSQESCCPITKPEEAEDRLGDSSHVQEYNTSCCCTEHFAVTNSHLRAQTSEVILLQKESWTLKRPVHPSTCWIWEPFTAGRVKESKENAVVGGGSGAVQCWGMQQSFGQLLSFAFWRSKLWWNCLRFGVLIRKIEKKIYIIIVEFLLTPQRATSAFCGLNF